MIIQNSVVCIFGVYQTHIPDFSPMDSVSLVPIILAVVVVVGMIAILIVGYVVLRHQKIRSVEILVSEGNTLRSVPRNSTSVSGFHEFEVEYVQETTDVEFASEKYFYQGDSQDLST